NRAQRRDIVLVGARRSDIHAVEGQADGSGLGGDELLAYAMHRYAAIVPVDSGDEGGDLEFGAALQPVECQRRILAAAPEQDRLPFRGHARDQKKMEMVV